MIEATIRLEELERKQKSQSTTRPYQYQLAKKSLDQNWRQDILTLQTVHHVHLKALHQHLHQHTRISHQRIRKNLTTRRRHPRNIKQYLILLRHPHRAKNRIKFEVNCIGKQKKKKKKKKKKKVLALIPC